MKNFLTSLIFSFSCLLTSAQQDRFIYLQTENQQPFFVKLNNKVFNSYPLGYLIVPKLDDGLYSVIIGFPESDYQQEFNCSIKNKDVGFLIKNVGEKQWQLVNLQTQSIIVPGDVITKPVIVYEKETDPFSTMLANAVHDSTILRKDVATQIPEKQVEPLIRDTTQAISNNDVATLITDNKLDSFGKETKEIQPEKTELVQKSASDTLHTALVNKADNIVIDTTNKVVTIEVVSDPQKTDTASAILPTDIAIHTPENMVKKDSIINIDTAKITANEVLQKDTSQAVIPNEVAVTKPKKKKGKKKDDTIQDSTLVQNETVNIVPEKVSESDDTTRSTTLNNDIALLRSTIKRKSRKTNKDGIEMMYIDDNGETKDTIRIVIPSEKKIKKDAEINAEPVVVIPVNQNDEKKADSVTKSENKLSDEEKKVIQEAKETALKSTMINSDCKNFATEEDFLRTRKKMVAENNDEDMIRAAKKIFKTRCFTTEQIKNLSVLFLKDEGKYMFFDAAYPFVSDSDIYSTLEKQLTDNYYITRFRAMTHK